ncbi:nose resistant to fluoxetine protein 6-like [Limulus polyphemus]|uniref:Nose resistant to fluoxetine protein 6-like n=1 Tax=Limulus polyphemus TaxID=6850 RepID=A0ABM1S7J6_LIMPO|nr:nose resistant to fluoxetine protein 6-like [Limulus polyphemus]
MNLEKNGKLVQKFFLAFSLYSNGKQLFDLNQRPGEISALNGIRFITLTWIILCHTYAFALLVSFRDLSDLQDSTEDLAFEVILNGWVSVDTFFFLSGLLVAYITLRRLEKSKGKMNFGLYLFHRYWRLTPTLMLVISILILMEGLGSGPLWDMQVRSEAERCRSSWWANLLYINNWRDHKYRCLPHLWYISVDMQLYVISLLILIPLFWKPIVGFLVLFLMVLGSNLAVGLLTAFNNYFPTVLHLAPDAKFNEEIVMDIYWKPYTHMGPYCVGIIVAYLILHYRDTVIDPALQVFLWIIAITCNVSTLYGAYEFNRGNLPPAWEAGLYASLYHTVWAVGLGWLTFACATGRGGLINSFLSWKIFLPLGRLTYSAYLCHFVIFWVRNGLQRERRNFSHFEQSFDFAGYITMTMFIALGVYLLFEAPFGALEKLMFPRGRQNKDDVKTKQDTETSAPTFGRWKQCSSKTAVVLKQVNFKENIFTLPTENT